MNRTDLPLLEQSSAPFDLETFVKEAATRNQHTLEAFTLPFPKAPDRWLSHDQCRPRPVECTVEDEGGLSWLIGATIDLRFTRALLAPYYAKVLYAARTASERTNRNAQEVIDNSRLST
jgi:hypothetical protein